MEKELNGSLVILECMGLQFFSLKTLEPGSYQKRPSNIRVAFLLLLLLLISGMMYYFTLSARSGNENITAKNLIIFAIQRCLEVGYVTVIFIGMVQSLATTINVKKFFINTKLIGKLISQDFSHIFSFEKVRDFSMKRFIVMMIFFATVHGTASIFQYRANGLEGLIEMFIGAAPVFFLMMIVYKFVFYIDLINRQLEALKELFRELFLDDSSLTMINCNQKAAINVLHAIHVRDNSVRKLYTMRKIYNLIHENGELASSSNGLTIMVLIVVVVISLTSGGYNIFVTIVGDFPKDQIIGNIR